jgi:hypothetical protein
VTGPQAFLHAHGAALLAVAAVVMVGWQLRLLALALASTHWPAVAGEVLATRIDTHHGEATTSFTPHVRYRYRACGRSFEARRLSYRPMESHSLGAACAPLRELREGGPVTVFCDPSRPRRSVLVPGAGPANAAGVVVSLVILGVALAQLP